MRGKVCMCLISAGISLLILLNLYQLRANSYESYLSLLGAMAGQDEQAAVEAVQRELSAANTEVLAEKGMEVLDHAGYGVTGTFFLEKKYNFPVLYVIHISILIGIMLQFLYFSCQQKQTNMEILRIRKSWAEAERAAASVEKQYHLRAKQMDQFMGNIYHQMKTPMANLKLCLEICEMEVSTDAAEILQRGILQAEKLSALLTVLLKEGQLHANKIRFHYQPAEVNDLLIDAIRFIRPFAEEKKMEIQFQPCEEANIIRCDEVWLAEAFQAILQNCVEHGKEKKKICIEAGKRKDRYTVDICAEGAEIGAEERAHLFERWYTGSTDGTHFGIGMHLVKTVIERHFGTIEIKEDGAFPVIFHIELPHTVT